MNESQGWLIIGALWFILSELNIINAKSGYIALIIGAVFSIMAVLA